MLKYPVGFFILITRLK